MQTTGVNFGMVTIHETPKMPRSHHWNSSPGIVH